MSLASLWELMQTLTGYLSAVLAAYLILNFVRDFLYSSSFIANVLGESRLSGAGRMAMLLLRNPWLVPSWRGKRFRAARLLVEMEILNPAADKPNRFEHSPQSYRAAEQRWRDNEAERRAQNQGHLKSLLDDERQDLKGEIFARVVKLISKRASSPISARATVHLPSFATLDEKRQLVHRYINVLDATGPRAPARGVFGWVDALLFGWLDEKHKSTFISKTEITNGYFSPIFLITGLMNRFDDDDEEDGWKLIINNYRQLVERDQKYSESLRELRSFLFNCWLLWGPSIPMCKCEAWSAGSQTAKNNLMLQYGFGDENNSIQVAVTNGRQRNFRDAFGLRLANDERYAIPYNVKGHLRWGPKLDDSDVSSVQRLIQGGTAAGRDPLRGRIVLECSDDDCDAPESAEARYYSAYVWMMFVLLDGNGQPFFDDKHWKNLLVVYEHGNIADATTYQTSKESLVAKVCSAFKEILLRAEDQGVVRIAYACAFDDANCKPACGNLFPLAEGNGIRPVRLLDILRAAVQSDAVLKQAAEGVSPRLMLADCADLGLPNAYSSCHLPEMVEKFYDELKRASKGMAAAVTSPAVATTEARPSPLPGPVIPVAT